MKYTKAVNIIRTEVEIWKIAYPKEAKVLDKFAEKIIMELRGA